MNHLAFSFFGTFQARLGDAPLSSFRSAKAQGLLIYLVLTVPHAHGRDQLAALLWPEQPEQVAKQNLRQALYLLRKVLGDDQAGQQPFLGITRMSVHFNPASDYQLDVADFSAALAHRQLETAVALYHGDLLPGFSCDSVLFDAWLSQERERLQQRVVEALATLTTDRLAHGDFQHALGFARHQLALEPWREEAYRQVMQAFAALGERSAALAQYEACRAVLAEELGIAPAAETAELAQRIRADQIQRPSLQQAMSADERPRLALPFVGRQAEYETLVNAYRRTSSAGLQVVTLAGNAGMGKTRLTEQFVTWAATQGADILVGRSYETSAGLSYQPLTQLLRQRIERENAPDDLLSDLWLAQLTRLLPELRERYPDLPEPTQEEHTARQHLFEAITRLGQALAAHRPLVVFLDDWHWADNASREVLPYAAQRWAEAHTPILLLLTLRHEVVTESPELQRWLTQLKRSVSVISLTFDALSPTETTQLLHMLLTPEGATTDLGTADRATPGAFSHLSRWLFAQTQGQPLFLTEALKVLVEENIMRPDPSVAPTAGSAHIVWQLDWALFDAQRAETRILAGLREIIQGWLTRISTAAAELLLATAVLLQEATFDHLCRVTGLEEGPAVLALDELLKRQLVVETGPTQAWAHDPVYAFSHQKISEVIYSEAGTARRRLFHRRAFELLQASAVPASDLAHHALNAGLLAETIRYRLIAGNDAMRLLAHQVAITHYEHVQRMVDQEGWPAAISGADRQTFYSALGRAYELTEAWDQAKAIYAAMITDAKKIGATAMECLGLNHLATVSINSMVDRDQAISLLKQARAVAEQHADQRGLAQTEWNLAYAAAFGGDPYGGLTHGEQALTIARTLGHPQLIARCLGLLAMVNFQLRRWAMVEVYASESRQLYITAADSVLAADSQRLITLSQICTGRSRESLATLQQTFDFLQRIENLWGAVECARLLSLTWLELGQYGHATSMARHGIEQARTMGQQMAMVDLALTVWAVVQRALMALDAAQATLLAVWIEDGTRGLVGFVKDWILSELCASYALRGDWVQAHDYALQRLQAREDQSLLPMGFTGWYETEALLRGGTGDLARAEVERLAGTVGANKRYRLILLRSQAVLAQWDGDVAQATSHLEAALTLAREMELPGEAWPILGSLGALYVERGDRTQARQAYQEAAAIIRRLAATIDAADLRAGFLAAGPVRSILVFHEHS